MSTARDNILYSALWILFLIIIYRMSFFISLPGFLSEFESSIISNREIGIIERLSGGSNSFSIVSHGIMPYIVSSIVVQLMFSSKKDASIKGDISFYSKICAFALSSIYSLFFVLNNLSLLYDINIMVKYINILSAFFCSIFGVFFLIWMADIITSHNLGNGISILIFINISSTIPGYITNIFSDIDNYIILLFSVMFTIFFCFFVILCENCFYKIAIHKSRVISSINVNNKDSTHDIFPIKVNITGVMPYIFSGAVIATAFYVVQYNSYLSNILNNHQFIYVLCYVIFACLFCVLYIDIVFDADKIADNLKKNGVFISGIRPGYDTKRYIDKIKSRILIFNMFCVSIVCIISTFDRFSDSLIMMVDGISIVIIVSVVGDVISHVNNAMISKKYHDVVRSVSF